MWKLYTGLACIMGGIVWVVMNSGLTIFRIFTP
jgi:hypothetical protein